MSGRIGEFMSAYEPVISKADMVNLHAAFRFFDVDQNEQVTVSDLESSVVDALHQNLTDGQLHAMIQEVSAESAEVGSFDVYDFISYALSRRVDGLNRLQTAFNYFDHDKDGRITLADMRRDSANKELSDKELADIFAEADVGGNGWLDFDAFCRPVHHYYSATQLADAAPESAAQVQQSAFEGTPEDAAETPVALSHSAARSATADDIKRRGSSLLQVQIGLFRLIQGAAYRCFRASFSANHATHLPVKDLPYRISDFVRFVDIAISFYKSLGVVSADCYPLLDALPESLRAEQNRLEERIRNWQTIDKSPEMLSAFHAASAASTHASAARAKFVKMVEQALAKNKTTLEFMDLINEVLMRGEMHRLREAEGRGSVSSSTPVNDTEARAYLRTWNKVILQDALETVDGALMPVAYWYEDFMPKLLTAFSVSNAADIADNVQPNERALSDWVVAAEAAGEFERYGSAIPAAFKTATADEKLRIRQAWRLTRHYLNGIQKRRERAEMGRDSGALSQYVAFTDVYFGQSFVRDADMRVSFPYYVGPAVWRFLHTAAEIAASQPLAQQAAVVDGFKEFFSVFAKLYPCPYCRHHLNAYVVRNVEINMYPLEYILLGRNLSDSRLRMDIADKLATVLDGASLRLFLWKLHNTVSSSISRSEEWYQQNDAAFYTTRFWPNIESELARAHLFGQESISAARTRQIFEIFKPLSRLSFIRSELHKILSIGADNRLKKVLTGADRHIADLESAVIQGAFLQTTYQFEAGLVDPEPSFTKEDELFARHAAFVEG